MEQKLASFYLACWRIPARKSQGVRLQTRQSLSLLLKMNERQPARLPIPFIQVAEAGKGTAWALALPADPISNSCSCTALESWLLFFSTCTIYSSYSHSPAAKYSCQYQSREQPPHTHLTQTKLEGNFCQNRFSVSSSFLLSAGLEIIPQEASWG